ncbi:MAG: MliC family protein [Devosia sp.]|uniref:MliC family protein n=1 Tax=Devosia sp. TaxID=1871048 RepID=UPI001AC8EE8C|nr:MliC family protein [Devosia sp.]MBN9309808.1 MliC family protein [Devosia sp.]MBN9316523.1 MliC family protein [Devosia sp.]
MEALAAAAMMGSADVSAQVVLQLQGNFERNIVQYQCEGLDPFTVDFINAEPNFLAVIPVGPRKMVFVNVMSASGAKYVAGQFEFWTKGSEATLTDLQATPPSVECTEVSETP